MSSPDNLCNSHIIQISSLIPQISEFKISADQLAALLEIPNCMLAGGAAVNILYNHLHPDNQKSMNLNESALDFFIYDPQLEPGKYDKYNCHKNTVFQSFNSILSMSGYIIEHARIHVMEMWADKYPNMMGSTQFSYKRWVHPVERVRVTLFFTSTPPDETLLNFELPICRARVVGDALQWTEQCERILCEHHMKVSPPDASSVPYNLRVDRYERRYGLTVCYDS